MNKENDKNMFSSGMPLPKILDGRILDLVLAQIPDALLIHIDGIIAFANNSAILSTGYSADELIGKNILDFVCDESKQIVLGNLRNRANGLLVDDCEILIRKKNGDIKNTIIRTDRIQHESQDVIITILLDISHRTKTERALLESEEKFSSIIGNLSEVVFQTDLEGLWIFLNPAWERVTGYSVEESIGKPFFTYLVPEDVLLNQERFVPLINREKEYCRHEIRYKYKTGGFRWIEVYARLTFNKDGNATGTSGTLNDITARKTAEISLIRKEKL